MRAQAGAEGTEGAWVAEFALPEPVHCLVVSNSNVFWMAPGINFEISNQQHPHP